MIITTIPAFFGKSVNIGDGKEVVFDKTGHCNIDDKVGAHLIEKYSTFMFDKNAVKAVEPTVQQEVNQELVNSLRSEIFDLKSQNEVLKEEKEAVQSDLEAWRSKIEEMTEKVKVAEEALAQEVAAKESITQLAELKVSLATSTVEQLKQLCLASEYDIKEYEKLSKDKLIEYILSKG